MVSLGIGLNNFTMETIKSSGSLTAIEIYNYQGMQGEDKTEEDFITDETIKSFSQIPHVTSVYPILNINVLMKQGIYEGYVTMMGVPLDYMKDIPLGAGKLPSPNADMLEMVVGNMVARNFTNSKTGKGYWERIRMWILWPGRRLSSSIWTPTISRSQEAEAGRSL